MVSFAGYFFYLTRRVSGGLIVPAVLHGMFDFSILSGGVTGDGILRGRLGRDPGLSRLVAIILLARRRASSPAP